MDEYISFIAKPKLSLTSTAQYSRRNRYDMDCSQLRVTPIRAGTYVCSVSGFLFHSWDVRLHCYNILIKVRYKAMTRERKRIGFHRL